MSVPVRPAQAQPHIASGAGSVLRNAFALWGGPAAWFIQLCAGYWLASRPCFPHDQRLQSPLDNWSMHTMIALLILGVLLALAAAQMSGRTYAATREAARADAARTWTGRACFLALWGLVWNIGFAATTLATAVAYITLPRCGG